MSDEFITIGELLLCLALFVGPLLVAGATAQAALLWRARVRGWRLVAILATTALASLAASLGLAFVLPYGLTGYYGDVFSVPALLSAAAATLIVALRGRAWRPAA